MYLKVGLDPSSVTCYREVKKGCISSCPPLSLSCSRHRAATLLLPASPRRAHRYLTRWGSTSEVPISPLLLQGEVVSNHDELMSNFFAQADALALGKTPIELRSENVSMSSRKEASSRQLTGPCVLHQTACRWWPASHPLSAPVVAASSQHDPVIFTTLFCVCRA